MSTSHRRSDVEVREFDAPPSLPDYQQKVLVDLIELHLDGKQAHWNVVGTIRTVHDHVDAADPSSADLLHVIVDDMEKAAWMLKSENRKI